MPDDHDDGDEATPLVTPQPILGLQEPEIGSRGAAAKKAPRRGEVPTERAADLEVLLRGAARGARRPPGSAILDRGGDPGGGILARPGEKTLVASQPQPLVLSKRFPMRLLLPMTLTAFLGLPTA